MNITQLIQTVSITAQVTSAIRKSIISGEYEPGKQLSEAALSQSYKVSRTPVREALKQLEREGLVEIIPRVGTCVRKPTEKELDELFTVKEALEGFAAGILAESKDPESIHLVQEAVALMETAADNHDVALYVEANEQFHAAILKGANNSKLSYLFNLLLNQIPYNQYVYISIDDPNRLHVSLKEHQIIMNAILTGNKQEAEDTMRRHVKASAEGLKNGIAKKMNENVVN
ncbi:GntR family transcriptional regulator [Sporosarcina sp. P12(2017)]|uniref:GntR family transcriptional regulator n=1 Tax=unclassified Sporosarcina TaxID=2647733 RepID=UPI000C1670BA|nr:MULTISPECIES: GntR family transcriptional regulator [unclassified Sporosarcina]PIC57702.1 GntR family transcriptional regulator [Sporosarcina sp. P10]PIC61085.1 GntR family transcriptional regulator [Sporosarcina sp. P12(2017)]